MILILTFTKKSNMTFQNHNWLFNGCKITKVVLNEGLKSN